MKKTIIFLFMIMLLLGITRSSAQVDLQLGARPQGMGGVFVAIANDANAVYWNPAGLALIRGGDFHFMHWTFEEITQVMVDYLAMAYPLYKGGVGFSWVRQGAELEEGRLGYKSTMSENSFLLSYGLQLTSRFSFGASLNRRVIYSKEGSGAGLGFEFGGLYWLVPEVWTFGIVAKNVAANMKNESLDPTLHVGTAIQLVSGNRIHNFTLAGDLNTLEDIEGVSGTTLKYATGFEYMMKLNTFSLAFRGGVGTKNYALGFGIGINTVSIDYAYVIMQENTIGNSHKFGLSFQFGKSAAPQSVLSRRESTPTPLRTKSTFNLTAQLEKDKVILKWDSVKGCEGYQLFGRIPGNIWKQLSRKIIYGTQMSIARGRNGKKVELKVRAISKGKFISESNSVTVN